MGKSRRSKFELPPGDMLSSSESPLSHHPLANIPRTFMGEDVKVSKNENSEANSPVSTKKLIMVANFLPLHAEKDSNSEKWSFTFDEDSILLQMKDGFPSDTDVYYVGSLKVDVDLSEQEEVAEKLLEEYSCVPTFLSPELQNKFYHGFCKHYLWPHFHYMLPIFQDFGNRFNWTLWQAYISANKIFADKVMEITNTEDDYVWVHDYHLMVLPMFLRRRAHRVKLGFFLHSPFPSSEIYRTLTIRDEILRSLLSCDLIGFHTFDYACHFFSCCSRILGLDYESKRGQIVIEYFGREIFIKILPAGIHMGRIESALNHPLSSVKVKELQKLFKGKTVIIAIDDMDIFKGINLKLQAMDQLLQQYPRLWGSVVLVQIVNPERSGGKDIYEARREVYLTCQRINAKYSFLGYAPVVLIDQPLPLYEKTAYYALAECCIINAIRDGMNLMPYEYIVCRQGTPQMDEALGITEGSPRTSALVLSEFLGCSPSLNGAIRVNPWNVEAVANTLHEAIRMPTSEKRLRHEKHYQYVRAHDVAYWARSFMQDLEHACKDHGTKLSWGLGFGLDFRVLALSPNFRKLSLTHIVDAYKRTATRAIFLDYDGTLVPHCAISRTPGSSVTSVLKNLCSDQKNTVFIVSGRGKDSLGGWFVECENLGMAAEHGHFIRWTESSDWEMSPLGHNSEWKKIAEPVMRLYTETTDGSYIEAKETALVWHHRNPRPPFGLCQAKELLNHLGSVLANEPVVVRRGHNIVEVKPQGITKGLAAEKILTKMIANRKLPDFVLCIGDDRSDEEMFASITNLDTYGSSLPAAPEIFACTVGQKPSKARYYLEDPREVMTVLRRLVIAESELKATDGGGAETGGPSGDRGGAETGGPSGGDGAAETGGPSGGGGDAETGGPSADVPV